MSVIYLDPTDCVLFQDSDLNYRIWSPKYLADAVRFYRDNSTSTCTCQSEVKDDLASLVSQAVSLVQTYLILGDSSDRTLDQVNVALQVLRMATTEDAE